MKSKAYAKLTNLVEGLDSEGMVTLISNFLNSDQLNEFVVFIEKELGFADPEEQLAPDAQQYKQALLDAFRDEYRQAYEKSTQDELGILDDTLTQVVITKYMDLDTDLFDSDHLNDIIDEIEKINQ